MRTIPLALASLLALAGCTMTEDAPPTAAAASPPKLMAWPDLLERERPQPTTSIRYGDQSMHVVDLWLPDGKGPHPTVLMVHGGCWQTEIADRRIMNWIADDLRKRGVAVWNIDYRGVDREGGGYPGTFLDAGAAADALFEHAPRYNLDLDPLVGVGHSAGGHLALWLAARPIVRARATTLIISAVMPGLSPEEMEVQRTRPLERIARRAPGVRTIQSSVGEVSRTLVTFQTPTQAQAAELLIEREMTKAGLTGDVSWPASLPANSPVLAGKPIPIHRIVSLGGLPDLELAATPPGSGCGTKVIEKLVGPATLSSRNVFADTSVPRLAPLGVPQILINGAKDRIIPTDYAFDYERRMRAAGDEVKVRILDDTGHVELIAPETAAWAAAVDEIEAALGAKSR